MFKNYRLWIICAAVLLLAGGGVALAAEGADPGADVSLGVAQSIYNAFAGGHYAYAAALGVILGCALIKRYAGKSIPWLHTEAGGATLNLVGASSAALAAGLASGGAITLGLVESSLMVGVGAAGGAHVLEHLLVEPWLKPLQAKLPAWAQSLMRVVLWVWDKPDPTPPPSPPQV